MLALAIQADGAVRTITQNAADQFGQYASGTDFNKGAHAAGVHRFDLLNETHGLCELRGELFAYCCRFFGIGCSGGIAINVKLRRIDFHALQELAEGQAGAGDQRAVKCGGNWQPLGGHTLGGQRRFDLDDFFNRAGEHNLSR